MLLVKIPIIASGGMMVKKKDIFYDIPGFDTFAKLNRLTKVGPEIKNIASKPPMGQNCFCVFRTLINSSSKKANMLS